VAGIPLEGMMGYNLKELNQALFDRRRIDGSCKGPVVRVLFFFLVQVEFDEIQSTRVLN